MTTIDAIIKKRKTQKILAESSWTSDLSDNELQSLVSELLDLAAHAPYHYRAHENHNSKALNSCLPYRAYILNTKKCRETATYMSDHDVKAGKIKNLLLSSNALLLFTWLPETHEENKDGARHVTFEGNIKNMEHIAAASAAIQNVLLGATAREIPNYWSTGGPLRTDQLKNYLGIPVDEIVMGSIFLYPKDAELRNPRIIPGAMRNEGKEINTWSKWV